MRNLFDFVRQSVGLSTPPEQHGTNNATSTCVSAWRRAKVFVDFKRCAVWGAFIVRIQDERAWVWVSSVWGCSFSYAQIWVRSSVAGLDSRVW